MEPPRPEARQLTIAKPRLGHPEALFTGSATFENLLQDLAALAADPKLVREISVPDPDVVTLEITVEAKALDGDLARYLTLYTTTRTFDQDELTITLAFEDHENAPRQVHPAADRDRRNGVRRRDDCAQHEACRP